MHPCEVWLYSETSASVVNIFEISEVCCGYFPSPVQMKTFSLTYVLNRGSDFIIQQHVFHGIIGQVVPQPQSMLTLSAYHLHNRNYASNVQDHSSMFSWNHLQDPVGILSNMGSI